MVKHIQNNCLSCLSVFDHFVRLALKGLMSLSRQARVGNFGFNLATPSFVLSRSLLLQSKSHQIIITIFFPRFLWTTFYSFLQSPVSREHHLRLLSTSFSSLIALIICHSTPHTLNLSALVSYQVSLPYIRIGQTQIGIFYHIA